MICFSLAPEYSQDRFLRDPMLKTSVSQIVVGGFEEPGGNSQS